MSLASALSIALSGLTTSSDLISLASDNISNAQTPGYARQTANLTSLDLGSQSAGVTIASYTNAADQALTENLNSATSQSSYYSTQSSYMQQVQTILNSSSSNPAISSDIAAFSSAWSQYSADPSNPVQQENVINAGETLASDINTAAGQIASLNTQVQSDITTDLGSLNADLKNVATLNTEIQNATTSGQPTDDLEDQLNTAINQISAFTTVSIQQRANGQIAIYTPSGQPMVDGPIASQYTYDSSTVPPSITDANGVNVAGDFTGGSIQASLQFIDTSTASADSTTPGVGVIAKLQSQLSTLVGAFTSNSSAFNTAYTNAYNAATTGVASSFFSVTNDGSGNPEPSSFQVNASLVNGTADLPSTNTQTVGAPNGLVTAIANSFQSTSNYTASGLTANSVTYAGLGSAVLSNFQQIANTLNTQSTTAASLQSQYQTQLTNETGVNLDQELANLTAYQNSYAASAHVISTINAIYSTLLNAVTPLS